MKKLQITSHILPLLIVLAFMCFYFYDYFLQTLLSVLPAAFFNERHFSTLSFGFLSAAFFYGYVIFQIPLGFSVDRFGLKYTAILCTFLCVLGTMLFCFSHHLTWLFLGRFLMGAGTATACVMAVYAISVWMPSRFFTLGVGIVQVMGCLGSVFGQAFMARLMLIIGWQTVAFLVTGFGLMLLVAYVLMPKSKAISSMEAVRIRDLFNALLSRDVLIICLLGFIAWAPVSVLAATWMVRVLKATHGWAHHSAANLLMGFWIGLAVSSLIIGRIAIQLGSYQKVVRLAFMLQIAGGLMLLAEAHLNGLGVALAMMLLGCAAAVQTLTFMIVADCVSPAIFGAAAAFVNMTAAFSGGAINPLFAWLLHYSHQYWVPICFFPLASLLGLYLTRFIAATPTKKASLTA